MDIADLAEVTHDPLLAQVRYQLRKHYQASRQKKIGLTCVFSREAVLQPVQLCDSEPGASDGSLNCHGYGSVVSVTSTSGFCAAGWALDQLASSGR